MLVWTTASGYYLGTCGFLLFSALVQVASQSDVGASQLIADGKIKLKNDSQIKEYTETGLLFEDGSQLPADVVVFATGFVWLALVLSLSESRRISGTTTLKNTSRNCVVTR